MQIHKIKKITLFLFLMQLACLLCSYANTPLDSYVLAPKAEFQNLSFNKDGNMILKADDGTEFVLNKQSKDKGPWGTWIKLTLNKGDEKVGYCHFRVDGDQIILSFTMNKEWNYASWYGIYVDPSYINEFKGLGRSLLNIAASIGQREGVSAFRVENIIDEYEGGFFERCGFNYIDATKSASLILSNEHAIPDINIQRVKKALFHNTAYTFENLASKIFNLLKGLGYDSGQNEIFKLVKDVFNDDEMEIILKNDLITIYETILKNEEADLNMVIQRLYYDVKQILLYLEMLQVAGKHPSDLKSLLALANGKWDESLGMSLLFNNLKKGVGFDFSDSMVEEAEDKLKLVKESLDKKGISFPFITSHGNAFDMKKQDFVKGLKDGKELEQFDLLTWVHPVPGDWLLNKGFRTPKGFPYKFEKFITLLEGLKARLKEDGLFLMNLDHVSWVRHSENSIIYSLFLKNGFIERQVPGTLSGMVGFNYDMDKFLSKVEYDRTIERDTNVVFNLKDRALIGGKASIEKVLNTLNSWVAYRDKYGLSDDDFFEQHFKISA